MATKQKNTKNRKTLLWVGLGVLAAGILAFGGAFAFGALVLARDLLYLAVFADTLIVGGALGKTAVDAIAHKVSNKNQINKLNHELAREQEREQTQSQEEVFTLGEKVTPEDIGRIIDSVGEADYQLEGQTVVEFPEVKKAAKKTTPKSR